MPSPNHASDIESAIKIFHDSYQKVLATDSIEDLDRCIGAGRELVGVLDQEESTHGMKVMEVCSLMGYRWSRAPSAKLWAGFVKFVLHWRKLIPLPDWRACLYIVAHGLLLYQRAIATSQDADIASAVATLEEGRSHVNPDSGVHGTSSAYLSDLRFRRFAKTVDIVDLEDAIQDAWSVLLSSRARKEDQLLAARVLAQASLSRFTELHFPQDLETAIAVARDILDQKGNRFIIDASATLGAALRQRFKLKHDQQDLEDAIKTFKSALQMPIRDRAVEAVITDNLGNCMENKYELTKYAEDLDEAIACSKRALQLTAPDSHNRPRTHANLAASLIMRARDRNQASSVEEAIQTIKDGLQCKRVSVENAARLHLALADGLLLQDALSGNSQNLDGAIAVLEKAFATGLAGEGDLPVRYRLARRGNLEAVTSRLIGTLLVRAARNKDSAVTDLWRCIAVGEAGKVVLLTQELMRRSLPQPKDVDAGLIQQEAMLLSRLADLDAREIAFLSRPTPKDAHGKMILRGRLLAQLESVWHEIAAASPEGKDYVEMRQLLPTEIMDRLRFHHHDHVLLSLLGVKQLGADALWHSGLCLLMLNPAGASPEIIFRVLGDPIEEAKTRFKKEVIDDRGAGLEVETWWQTLAQLIGPRTFAATSPIVLSLSEDGTGLPWQVVFECAGWVGLDQKPCPFLVVPSFVILVLSAESAKSGWTSTPSIEGTEEWILDSVQFTRLKEAVPATGPLVVGNPGRDLNSALNEAQGVGKILGVEPLLGEKASTAAVRKGFAESNLVHVAAHARFDPDDPLQSAILLADGELKAHILVGQWSTAKLVVLSACQSGANRPWLGGELLGLATALLRSGVRNIVASLWSVDDAATEILMTRLYKSLTEKVPLAAALRDASKYVRDQPGWEPTYYWAPFILLSQTTDDNLTLCFVEN